MALNVSQVTADAKAAVEAEFPNFDNSAGQSESQVGASMGDLISVIVPVILNAIINDAEILVTDVEAGGDTAPGTIS